MNDILETLVTYAGIAIGSYTALLLGAELIQDLISEKITSKEQLDEIIEEEAENIGLDKRLVVGKLYASDDKRIFGARCYVEDFDFEEHTIPIKVVELKSGWGATRGAVRHEMYHLKNHFPRTKNRVLRFLKGLFYEEPTATLYAIIGIGGRK